MRSAAWWVFSVAAFVATSCASPPRPSAEPATDAPSAPSTVVIEVALSGDGCTVDGPTTLAPGETMVMFQNGLPSHGNLELLAIGESGSFDELAAHVSAQRDRVASGDDPLDPPAFVTKRGRSFSPPFGAGAIQTELDPGVYGLVCAGMTADERVNLGPFAVGPIEVRP
jgi:hypothetical protein